MSNGSLLELYARLMASRPTFQNAVTHLYDVTRQSPSQSMGYVYRDENSRESFYEGIQLRTRVVWYDARIIQNDVGAIPTLWHPGDVVSLTSRTFPVPIDIQLKMLDLSRGASQHDFITVDSVPFIAERNYLPSLPSVEMLSRQRQVRILDNGFIDAVNHAFEFVNVDAQGLRVWCEPSLMPPIPDCADGVLWEWSNPADNDTHIARVSGKHYAPNKIEVRLAPLSLPLIHMWNQSLIVRNALNANHEAETFVQSPEQFHTQYFGNPSPVSRSQEVMGEEWAHEVSLLIEHAFDLEDVTAAGIWLNWNPDLHYPVLHGIYQGFNQYAPIGHSVWDEINRQTRRVCLRPTAVGTRIYQRWQEALARVQERNRIEELQAYHNRPVIAPKRRINTTR